MNLSQAQQMSNKYKLDYALISLVGKKHGICGNFIDLFSSKNYKGKRHMCNGRVIIQIPVRQGQTNKYIIIDKDHSTRYLVQKIVSYSQTTPHAYPFQSIISFEGYKMELDKYMIHGLFEHFQMLSYKAYFGFEYLEEEQGKGKQLLFCKIQTNTQNTKYYYQKDLHCVKQVEVNEYSTLATDYFGPWISDQTLQNLNNQHSHLSTIIINYFFQRLMFSYYSQFWYNRSLPLIKIFQSQGVASFFWKQSTSLDFTYFQERFFNLYVGANRNALQEQELIFFPIFQQGQAHFVLGTIKIDKKNKKILLFELDPLEGRSQSWRNKLQRIVRHNDELAKQHNIPYSQYRLQRYASVKSIQAPQQLSSSDCGIYVCLYALMIMRRFGLIQLEQDVMKMCQQGEKSKLLIRYIRRYLFQSYKNRRIYFLDAFQDQFDISSPASLLKRVPINKSGHGWRLFQ